MAWPKDTWSVQIFSSHSPPFFLISLLLIRKLSTPLSEKCHGKNVRLRGLRGSSRFGSTRCAYVAYYWFGNVLPLIPVKDSIEWTRFETFSLTPAERKEGEEMKDPGNEIAGLLLQLCDISGWLVLTVSRKTTVLCISSTPKQNLMFPPWIRTLVSAFI